MKKIIFLIVITTIFMSCNENDDNTRKFTVSFNSNGGSAVEPRTVMKGEKVAKPVDLVLIGQTLVA